MKVLIIGSGGREHSIACKIAESNKLSKMYCAPSNPGINKIASPVNIQADDIDALFEFAVKNAIDLTVVGPEIPLAIGIVDKFEKAGLKIFGPDKNAAKIETSKSFAKEFMKKYGIPTANYKVFTSLDESISYINNAIFPLVIKYDGLAAGKGVTICLEKAEAEMVLNNLFKNNDTRVVIEEYLEGKEVSILAICDGNKAICMLPAQDYKPLGDGNMGPNTGGMGSYAPSVWVDSNLLEEIQHNIIDKTINALKSEGITYKGVLYAGLMISEKKNINVLEFNCRFGDPETQAILPLFDEDLLEILWQSASGNLKMSNFNFKRQNSVCVVLASNGYPGRYARGYKISGLEENILSQTYTYLAGVSKNDAGELLTAGGRVLNIVSVHDSLSRAQKTVYDRIESIHFKDKHYRKDIAADAIEQVPVLNK